MQLTTLLAPSLCRASKNNPLKQPTKKAKKKTPKHCLVELLHRSHFSFPVHCVSEMVSSSKNSLRQCFCNRSPCSHCKRSACSSTGVGSLAGVKEAEAVLEAFNEDFVAFEVPAFFSGKLLCLSPCCWPRCQEQRARFSLTYWWCWWR